MTSSEYKNTIEWTLTVQTPRKEDKVTTAKRILKNLGVPFPNGTLEEAVKLLSSRNYMGWNPCNAEQARYCANNGYTAIGVTNDSVVIIMPEDEVLNVENTLEKVSHPAVRKLSELSEEEAGEMQYFVFAILLEDIEPMQSEGVVKAVAAAATTCSGCQSCNTCQSSCERSCQTCNTCQSSCEKSCQTSCQVSCQTCNTCQSSCQTSCQTGCQVSCQTCNTCQSSCERSCQTSCQSSCQSSCEISCQTCNTCQGCNTCQTSCEISCQTCNTCQTSCQLNCQTTCESICQTTCQVSCQLCDTCQSSCQLSCQSCNTCQTGNTPKPVYPTITLTAPSDNNTETVGTIITISASGSNCETIEAYVNDSSVFVGGGNSITFRYYLDSARTYRIYVVATSSTGHTATSATRTITAVQYCTISYNLNGGKIDSNNPIPSSQVVQKDTPTALAALKNPRDCYKLNHTFDGWNTKDDGTGTKYFQRQSVSFNSDITLYAQFTEVN